MHNGKMGEMTKHQFCEYLIFRQTNAMDRTPKMENSRIPESGSDQMEFQQYRRVMGYKPMMVVVSSSLKSGNSSLLMRKKGLPHQYAAQVVFQKIKSEFLILWPAQKKGLICQA